MPRAAVKTVDVPTIDDLDEGQGIPGLYNARDEWFRFEFGSIPYYIPPDRGGILDDHPVKDDQDGEPTQVACNGELKITDRLGYVYKQSASGGPTSVRTAQRKTYEAARDIVRFAIRTYGDRGLTFLTGDERSDSIRKDQAKRAYLKAQIAADQYILQTWDTQITEWKKRPMNANQPLPTPPEPVRLARERLDARDAERRGIARQFKHVCNLCGSYATDDSAKFSLHLAVNHGQGELKSRPENVEPADVEVTVGKPKGKGRRQEASA